MVSEELRETSKLLVVLKEIEALRVSGRADYSTHSVADPEGVQGFALLFEYPMKTKKFGLSETKLFHFHGIFRENDIKSAKRTPTHRHIYEPRFQNSWIRPCHLSIK